MDKGIYLINESGGLVRSNQAEYDVLCFFGTWFYFAVIAYAHYFFYWMLGDYVSSFERYMKKREEI